MHGGRSDRAAGRDAALVRHGRAPPLHGDPPVHDARGLGGALHRRCDRRGHPQVRWRRVNPRAIVTDIEGTTSSLAFVHEVLFPYSRARLARFVADHPDAAAPILAEVRAEAGDPAMD